MRVLVSEFVCPECRNELELMHGDFGTGVYAPDGTEQTAYGEGYLCARCRYVWSIDDLEEDQTLEGLLDEVDEINAQLPDPEPEVDALKRWLS